jgi:hypothetical protein
VAYLPFRPLNAPLTEIDFPARIVAQVPFAHRRHGAPVVALEVANWHAAADAPVEHRLVVVRLGGEQSGAATPIRLRRHAPERVDLLSWLGTR